MADRESPRGLIVWAVAVMAAAGNLLWVLYQIRDVILVVYVSALFAIGFSPLIRLIERQRFLPVGTRRLPRWLVILVVYLVILGATAGVAALILPPLVRQARDFAADIPRLFTEAQDYLLARGILREPITWQQAIQQAPAPGGDAVGTIIAAVWGFVGGLVGVLAILILTFYFLVEADALFAVFLHLFSRDRRPQVATVSLEIGSKVSAWLGGQLLLAGVIGASTALALGFLGVPYFYVLALIAAVGEMIPVVGPVLSAIPGIAVAWGQSGKLALIVGVFFVIQQQLESNILAPKVMERQLGVSPATVIIALMAGSALLGILGAVLAVPTVAILQVLAQELVLRDEPPDPPPAGR